MSESKQRKIGALLSYIAMGISILVQLLYTPILITKLGQSEYGLYSLISSIIGYLTVLDLGFGNAIIVYTAKYRAQKKFDEENKLHGMFKIIFRIISIFAIIIGIFLYFNVENFFSNSMTLYELKKTKLMMIILTINLAITFNFTIYSSIISAYEKFIFQKLLAILNTISKPLLMIPLLFLGYKSITMCVVITIVNIAVVLINYLYCKFKLNINIKYCGFDKDLFKIIFGYSFFIFLGVIVDKINWSLDQFILGSMVGTKEIAIYAVACQFITLFKNISSCCCSIMLPKLSKMVGAKSSDKELNNEFIKFGRIQWYLILLILFGIIIFGYEFIKIWAGNGYEKAYYILLIMVIPEAFVLVENIGVYIMQAKNLHKTKAIIAFIIALLNICISIPLAARLGGVGTAIGTALALIVGNLIIINIYYYKKVNLNIFNFWKNILKISFPLIPLFVIVFFINKNIYVASSLLSIGVFAIIFSIIYFVIAYLFSFNDYEKDLVKGLFNIIKKKRGC